MEKSVRIWRIAFIGLAFAVIVFPVGGCSSTDDPGGPAGTSNLVVDLQDLKPSLGALSPAFDPAKQTYNVTVGNSASSVMVTAIVADARASLKINDQPAASGQPFGPIPLVNRTTNVPILVEALGLSKSYQVTITKEPTPDLQDLKVSAGALSPAFAPATSSYTVRTGFSTTTTTVTATVTDDTATLSINGEAATSGQPTRPFNLQVGKTTIPVVVTASDGRTKTYQVEITREGNTDLANLQTSAGPIAPAFDPKQLTYTASTGFSMTEATITITTADSTATVTINNAPATSGQAAGPFGLAVGTNSFTIVVTSPFSSVPPTTYSLTITRQPPSTNALLSDLAVSPPDGTVAGFDQNNSGPYTVSVASTEASVVVTATKSDAGATMSGAVSAPAGQAMGQATVTLNPAGTSTTISILVVAQDGVSSKSYTVIVNRMLPPCNPNLAGLTLSAGTIQFDPTTTSYTVAVPNTTLTTTVTATLPAGSTSTLRIIGQTVTSGQVFGPITLNIGNTSIQVVVTCPDGTPGKTYTVNVNRAGSSNNFLKSLSVSAAKPDLAFDRNTLTYRIDICCAPQSNTTVIAVPEDPTATMTISVNSGTPSILRSGVVFGPITFPNGTTTIRITVTAQNGVPRTYTVNIFLALIG
jgi:hypothetical protein